MKPQTLIIIILSTALLIVSIYGIYGLYQDHEDQLFADGYNQGQIELAYYQQGNSIYAYITNQTGNWALKFITLKELCGGAG